MGRVERVLRALRASISRIGQKPEFRFRIAIGLVVLTLASGLAALAWPDWVEGIAGFDPDGGDGSVEAGLFVALAVIATSLGVFVQVRWRRSRGRRPIG